jgi:hypothetical protein
MRDPDQSLRERLHAALSEWAAAQNVLGQVNTYTVSFPPEFDDDPPLDSIPMYESPGGDLGRLLDADAAARAGSAPDGSDAAVGLRYGAARLHYLLDGLVRCSGWPLPGDAAEGLGELARLAGHASELVEQADGMIGRELRAARVTPVPGGAGRTSVPADAAAKLHEEATAALAGLGEAAARLQRMQMRVRELQRTMQAAVAGTSDSPTLRVQYLVRSAPFGWPAVYHVRVFRPTRQRPLVIVGELGDNHSTHLNNCIEDVAGLISEHMLGTRDPDAFTWVQYDPAEEFYSEYDDHDGDSTRYDREDQAVLTGFEPDFTNTTRRKRIGHDELEQLAGGPVRRWHVHDYTIAVVTEAGAQPVDLTAPDRPRRRRH